MATHDMVRDSEKDADFDGAGSFDVALFKVLLNRIEQLSRELGRAESQRAMTEQRVARLEQQLAQLTREHEQRH